MLLSYTLDEYEVEIANAQDAFLGAARSQEPVALAAPQSLQVAFASAGFQLKGGALVRTEFDDHDRAVLDDVLRLLLVRVAGEAVSKGVPIMQYDGGRGTGGAPLMRRLLEMIKWIAMASTAHEVGVNSPRVLDVAAYCKLLEDLLELGTISDCQDVFACMEADLEFLASEAVSTAEGEVKSPSNAAQLTILRACNSLLRRLSKANDVQLCGRILVFIARLYPLTDKSGLNLHGVINAGLPLPIDDVAPDDVDSVGQPVDAKLYSVFWGLQNAFKNPAQLLQAAHWSRFREEMSLVLQAFDTLPITVPATGLTPSCNSSSSSAQAAGGRQHMELDAPALQHSAATSVKHLTSSKLFGLQVRDGTFRRHFLVQAAVLLHYMAHPSIKEKAAAAAVPAAVSAGKAEGLEELNTRVYAAISRTDHAGEEFGGAVRSVLEHETQWVAWKKESCPPFERAPEPAPLGGAAAGAGPGGPLEPAPAPRPVKRRRAHGDGRGAAARPTFVQMVSEPSDQMAGLKAAERSNMPSIKEMLAPLIEDLDPENCIEEEYRRKNDRVFAWKAHRLVAHTQLVHFATSKDLEEMIQKIDPDIKRKVEEHKALEAERLRKEKEEAAREETLEKEKEKEGARGAEGEA